MFEAYSIRQSLQGALQDFIRKSGFSDTALEELVRELVGLLALYREENLPLYPEVYLFQSVEGLKALAPSSEQLPIGRSELCAASAAVVIKNCATLAQHGWSIFIVKEEHDLRYGLFRSVLGFVRNRR